MVLSVCLCVSVVNKPLPGFLLTPPAHTFVPVDAGSPSVLVCDYTGKEVV